MVRANVVEHLPRFYYRCPTIRRHALMSMIGIEPIIFDKRPGNSTRTFLLVSVTIPRLVAGNQPRYGCSDASCVHLQCDKQPAATRINEDSKPHGYKIPTELKSIPIISLAGVGNR